MYSDSSCITSFGDPILSNNYITPKKCFQGVSVLCGKYNNNNNYNNNNMTTQQ